MFKPWREIVVPHENVLEGMFQKERRGKDLLAYRTRRTAQQ